MAPRRKQAWMGWGAPMQRVAGWDFDHRLNGYITTAADKFSCDCGEEFPTPSGYRKCGSCGRAWNSYVIGTDNHGKEASLEKVICREIPVRKDVIVASKRRQAENEFGFAFDKPKKKRDNASLFAEDQDEEGTLDKVSRHLRQAKDCKCWDGYCRVPGTKPCAKGSCEKCDGHREARRYVAWCRLVGRMPSTAGMRRFRTAERIVRQADKHNLRRRDLKELENPDEDEQNMSIEHFSSRRQAAPLWQQGENEHQWMPTGKEYPKALVIPGHNDYAAYMMGHANSSPEGAYMGTHPSLEQAKAHLENHWNTRLAPKQRQARRRRAELFDITEEGETPMGKGKSNTPMMRKNPANWTKHKQNGQFTRRWN